MHRERLLQVINFKCNLTAIGYLKNYVPRQGTIDIVSSNKRSMKHLLQVLQATNANFDFQFSIVPSETTFKIEELLCDFSSVV